MKNTIDGKLKRGEKLTCKEKANLIMAQNLLSDVRKVDHRGGEKTVLYSYNAKFKKSLRQLYRWLRLAKKINRLRGIKNVSLS